MKCKYNGFKIFVWHFNKFFCIYIKSIPQMYHRLFIHSPREGHLDGFQVCHSLFSHSVMFDSLQPHGLQHARPPCPSPSPWACSNSCPLSRCCHPSISSSVVPLCLQSSQHQGLFPMSQFLASGGQSIGATASVLPRNIQCSWYQFIKGSTKFKQRPYVERNFLTLLTFNIYRHSLLKKIILRMAMALW